MRRPVLIILILNSDEMEAPDLRELKIGYSVINARPDLERNGSPGLLGKFVYWCEFVRAGVFLKVNNKHCLQYSAGASIEPVDDKWEQTSRRVWQWRFGSHVAEQPTQ